MQLVMGIVAIVLTALLGGLAVLAIIMIASPSVAEGWVRRRSERSGIDFDAIVQSPERYRQRLQRQGVVSQSSATRTPSNRPTRA